MKTKQRLWMNGASESNAISRLKARRVLSIAQTEFETDALEALLDDEEIKVATYAIVEALPKRLRAKVTDIAFLDIASIILLQRAQAQYEIGVATGAQTDQAQYETPPLYQDAESS